jgi:hypothetical protein
MRSTDPSGPNRDRDRQDDPPGRRRYAAPELVEYGTVAKLTQTGGRTTVDFLFNLRRRMSGGGMM